MSTRPEALARAVELSKPLLTRYLAGFTDDTRATQADGLANHAAWTLGHLALTLHRAAEQLDGLPLPEADFVTRDGHGGSAERFDTESVSYGSRPVADAGRYPTLARATAIFETACDRLAAAVRAADDAHLDAEASWPRAGMTVADLVVRMVFHNGVHAGELVDLRRALGLGPVVG